MKQEHGLMYQNHAELLHSTCNRCLLKPTTSPTKAVSEVLFYSKQVQTKAIRDGIESESSIIQTFENETVQKVHKSGFFSIRCVS